MTGPFLHRSGFPEGVPPTASRGPRVRVVIAEDDPRLRLALGAVVSAERSLDLVGAAVDAEEAIALAAEQRPDVVVVDVSMPGGGGVRATREIRASLPGTRVVALSGHEDRTTVVEMLAAGASGYMVKGAEPEELIEAIHAVARGEHALSKQVTDGVVGALTEQLSLQQQESRRQEEDRAAVQRVLDERLVTMVFQPIVALRDRTVVGYEALARFTAGPAQAPDVWFATAERCGLTVPLELAAVEAAIAQLPLLPPGVFLSVNVSPDTAASTDFEAALEGAAPERIVVEITEHAPIDDYDAVTPGLQRLRARGIRLAIDDAGAGFASLRHILRLAPDFIKTDMTLTRNITSSRAERALTSALIAFAAETGARIIAEGIESDAELGSLRALGVRYGQGYHLGRPAPARPPASLAEARSISADEYTTATARRFLRSHR